MKSSSRIFKHSQSGQFTAWQMPDLVGQAEVETQEQAAEILNLFQLPETPLAGSAGRRSGLLQGGQVERLRVWNAPDLEYTPPFVDEDDEVNRFFIGDQPHPSGWEQQQEALSIIEQARQQAAEILRRAEEEAGQIRLRAADELEAMRQTGYQEGLTRAQEEMRNTLQACAELIAEAQAWKQNLVASSEEIVLDMVREMAVALFGQGVALDDQALQINLNRIVEKASTLGELKVYLNPKDAASLDPEWKEYQALVLGNKVQVIPAEGITRGGCYIQGQYGAVDARVETQLRNLLASFAEVQSSEEMAA
ncbi:FliH/SctL family protein [Bellilinea sp.]|uniref:FliH/SctL family protein n=1 Tax=Bellilinea sp. TaxID=2838785 RepID=UPI002ADDE1D4|nr:FliH/SctL family protein [Bellilinea sp.]